ncbi:hypothetical protein L207DRAFT_506764 [Hyaloscypha variabilis F]|uniref:Uncharacterized protein n=1 Tax=Hyaloscypha variabilis (strain UAMH 11265 / GT02V1 / F) TaxID=1149755 RepID=A0A2J6SAP0_HYAVF|nr:hypothetical protein L207DRAFT_506764 [Hyaloscypha variabilis F]
MATSPYLLLLSDSVLSNHWGRIMPWRISSPAALCHVLSSTPIPPLSSRKRRGLISVVHSWFLHGPSYSPAVRETGKL